MTSRDWAIWLDVASGLVLLLVTIGATRVKLRWRITMGGLCLVNFLLAAILALKLFGAP